MNLKYSLCCMLSIVMPGSCRQGKEKPCKLYDPAVWTTKDAEKLLPRTIDFKLTANVSENLPYMDFAGNYLNLYENGLITVARSFQTYLPELMITKKAAIYQSSTIGLVYTYHITEDSIVSITRTTIPLTFNTPKRIRLKVCYTAKVIPTPFSFLQSLEMFNPNRSLYIILESRGCVWKYIEKGNGESLKEK
jgi:hypothetical protein